MSEVDGVIVLCEGVRECQGKVASIKAVTFTLESVRVVANVVTDAMPRQLFGAVTAQLREGKDSHSLVI